jgi:hypothetical protein
MSLEKFADIYRKYGFAADIDGNDLLLELDGTKVRVAVEEEWRSSMTAFFKAKQYSFDATKRILISYKSVEFQVLRLDSGFSSRTDHEFSDVKGHIFGLSQATPEFILAALSSTAGERQIGIIKRRIARRADIRKPRSDGYIPMRIDEIIGLPNTARYVVQRKLSPELLETRGRERVKACLFKLAHSGNECWGLWESIRANGTRPTLSEEATDKSIPHANYNDDLVSFYKVAKSSLFPNQGFLSYYHILEYFFLRVADEIIHTSLKVQINSPSFSASYESINKLLSIIAKADNTSDETEMLKAVLTKYVPEDDLIEYIGMIEKETGEKLYSDNKKEVFGEKATIRLEKGHAISNTAKIIKHIRNALVHSSDRYSRENCFLPFSESETVVEQYIPIVKFLAEKVIFATAE